MSTIPKEVEVHHNEEQHRFEIDIDGQLALAEYRMIGDKIALTHTEVPESLEGKGIGSQLARTALDYARDHQLTVLPYCPFMAAYIKRHPEYQSLVGTMR